MAWGIGLAVPALGDESLAGLATRYLEGADVIPDFARLTTAQVEAEDRRPWRRLRFEDRRACGAVLVLCEAIQRGSGSTRPVHRVAILDLARDLLKRSPAGEGCGLGAEAARRLSLLAALTALGGSHLQEAHALLGDALRRHPRDPDLLTTLGTLQERIATLPRDEGGGAPKTHSIEGAGDAGLVFALPRATLDEAIATFRAALAADPGRVEARLRLGRLLVLRGNPEAAIAELDRARAAAGSSAQRSLAHLFLALAHERADRPAAAREAYAEAAREAPASQAAWLGLARVADPLGDREAAQEALARALQPQGEGRDPWAEYRVGTVESRWRVLESLRGEYRR